MTKTYHTMDKAEWAGLTDLFHPQHGSHYIDLPNGRIIVAVDFADEGAEEAFGLRSASRKSLPHPVFEGTDKIAAHHVAELGHLGVDKNSTVRDVIKKVSAIHPHMKLSIF
jgi:hypothetical protein